MTALRSKPWSLQIARTALPDSYSARRRAIKSGVYEVGGFSTDRETGPRESEMTPISPSTRPISIPALAREINDLRGWREFGTLSSHEHFCHVTP